jgi:beta-1,4-N-acetylglucosaminyltransferase
VARARRALRQGRVPGGRLLILVSLGTHEQPFERALDLVEALAGEEDVVVQHGHTPARPGTSGVRWLRFVSYEEMVALVREASGVLCHAGVGTVMTTLGLGRTPVVVPRLRRLGEHVDDHQLQITRALAARGLVVPLYEDDDPLAALQAAAANPVTGTGSTGDLKEAVRLAALGLPA